MDAAGFEILKGQFLIANARPRDKHLGSGAYGSVEEIEVNGVICAGKKIHEILINPGEELLGTGIARRFIKECQLMFTLRHPHLVQFLGVCFFPISTLPVLVMERLLTNLDNLLVRNPDIPLSLKRSILADVARGLVYLHKRNPPVIHRDLTARDILLNSAMVAKIGGLGCACTVNVRSQLADDLTRFPGALTYMPPEALKPNPTYGKSLDCFSFGQLSLFTITQEFPGDLLPSTYNDPKSGHPRSRTEVQRRNRYIQLLERQLTEQHLLTRLVKRCLIDDPSKRPRAEELLQELEGMQNEIVDGFMNHTTKLNDYFRIQGLEQQQASSSSRQELEGLQAQMDQLQIEHSGLLTDMQRSMDRKDDDIISCQRHSQRLHEECSRLEQQLQQQREQSSQEQQKYRQLTHVLQQRLYATQAEVQQLQRHSQQLQVENSSPEQRLRQQMEQSLQVQQEHQQQIPLLQQRHDAAQAKVQQMQQHNQQLREENSNLEQQLQQQREQSLQVQQEHRLQMHVLQQRLDAEVQQLQQHNQQLQEECSSLEQQLQQQREQSLQEQQEHRQQTWVLQQRLDAEVKQSQRHSQQLQEENSSLEQQLLQQREQSLQEQQEHRQQTQVLQQRLDAAQAEVQRLQCTPQVTSRHHKLWNLARQEVQVLTEIGRGAWGTVAKGKFRGQPVAVKWPHPVILNEHTIERLQREVQIMAQVQHPNLLRFIGAVFDDEFPLQPPLIVTELLDMNLRMAYKNERLTGSSKIPIFREVAYALHYLHEHQEPIIHRDVSAPNVLLEELPKGMWRAKVSDFGSANLARLAQTMGEGAIIYAAPETVPQTRDFHSPPPPQTTKIDVYSYGVLLCEVITSLLPDPDRFWSMLQQVKSQWPFMYELIITCTNRIPDERPTMAEVLDKLNELPRPRPRT